MYLYWNNRINNHLIMIKQFKYLESIRNNKISPVYLFIGEEEYFKNEAVNSIVDRILTSETRSFNYDILRGEEIEQDDIYKIAVSMPMLSEKRVVLIKNFEKIKQTRNLEKYIENPIDSSVLIFDSDKNSLGSSFFNKLKNRSFYAEFKPLYDNQVADWIKLYINKKGKKIADNDINLIYECVGNNIRSLKNEIEKICDFLHEEEKITTDVITEVVGISRDYNVFELRNAIGRKDVSKSIYIVNKMLETGENEAGIIVMLTRYFTELGRVKELNEARTPLNEISKKTGIHQFFLREYLENSRKYRWKDIRTNFELLLDTDYKLKTGFRDTKTLFTVLMNNLINSN